MERCLLFMDKRLNVKLSILPKMVYRFNAFPTKSQYHFYIGEIKFLEVWVQVCFPKWAFSSNNLHIRHKTLGSNIWKYINALPWSLFLCFSQMNPKTGRKHFSFHHKNVTISLECVHLFPPPWREHTHFQQLEKKFLRAGQVGEGDRKAAMGVCLQRENQNKNGSESKTVLADHSFQQLHFKTIREDRGSDC